MTRPTGTGIRSGTDHANAAFRGIALAGVELRDVHFADCTFDRCSLAGAVLSGCSFTGCTFSTSDLSLANVRGSRFMDVGFVDSKVIGVDWTTVDLPARLGLSVRFERSLVSQSAFVGLNLRGLRLVDSTARDADFSGADLTDAVCTGTDFLGARFGDATLVNADFRGATGYAIDPLRTKVAKARFSLPDAVALLDGLGIRIE